MDYGLNVFTRPNEEPISLIEAKAHLRVTISDDDDQITALIETAREFIEDEIGIVLVDTEYDVLLDRFPTGRGSILIPRYPLVLVDQITYVDAGGVERTLDPALYEWDASREPGRLYPAYGKTWPATLVHPRAVAVRFAAGFGDAADVPERAKSAVKLIVGHLYEHREENTELALTELPLGAQRLIRQLACGDDFTQYGDST
jgi:uncharacterized phiE125 gp8 family phage protein